MFPTKLDQRILRDYLAVWIEAFLTDRKAQSVSPETLSFYQKKLKYFLDFCAAQAGAGSWLVSSKMTGTRMKSQVRRGVDGVPRIPEYGRRQCSESSVPPPATMFVETIGSQSGSAFPIERGQY